MATYVLSSIATWQCFQNCGLVTSVLKENWSCRMGNKMHTWVSLRQALKFSSAKQCFQETEVFTPALPLFPAVHYPPLLLFQLIFFFQYAL